MTIRWSDRLREISRRPVGQLYQGRIHRVVTGSNPRNGDLNFLAQIYSNYYNFIPPNGIKTLPPETFPGLKLSPRCVCGQSSSRTQLAGGAHSAPPDPLAGLGEGGEGKGGEGKRKERRGRKKWKGGERRGKEGKGGRKGKGNGGKERTPSELNVWLRP